MASCHYFHLHALYALSFSMYISTNHVNFLSFDNFDIKLSKRQEKIHPDDEIE